MLSKKKYLILSPMGGLGNQIFQVLYGIYLSKITKRELLISDAHYKVYKKFPLLIEKIFNNEIINNVSTFRILIYKFFFNSETLFDENIFKISHKFKKQVINSSKDIVFIKGYWQSLKYLNEYINLEKILKKKFNQKKINIATDKVPVALHIRRGDYYSEKNIKKLHGIISDSYFKNCIEYFNRIHNFNVRFYIFSDDIRYTKNLSYLKNFDCKFINNTSTISSFIDLSFFQNYIISNSTFSLLAAFIAYKREQNINICAPKYWYGDLKYSDTELLMSFNNINLKIIDN
jgi:hypothetical protein